MTDGFSQIPWALQQDRDLKPHDWAVYAVLQQFTVFRTRRTKPGTSVRVIAERAHISVPVVLKALDRLAERGWIGRTRGGSTTATVYEVRSTRLNAVNGNAFNAVEQVRSTKLHTAVNDVEHKDATEPNAGKALAAPVRAITESLTEKRTTTPLPPKGGRGQSAPRAKPVAKKPSGPDVRPIFEALKVRGLKEYPSNLPAQIAAAQRLLQASYSADEIADCYMDVCRGDYGDTFLQGRLSFTMMENSDNIGNWKRWNAGGRQRNGYSNGHGQTRRNGSPLPRTQPTTTEEILAARDKMRAAGYGKPRLTGTEEDGVAQRRGQPGALEALIQAQIAAQSAARQHPPEEVTP